MWCKAWSVLLAAGQFRPWGENSTSRGDCQRLVAAEGGTSFESSRIASMILDHARLLLVRRSAARRLPMASLYCPARICKAAAWQSLFANGSIGCGCSSSWGARRIARMSTLRDARGGCQGACWVLLAPARECGRDVHGIHEGHTYRWLCLAPFGATYSIDGVGSLAGSALFLVSLIYIKITYI